MVLPSQVSDSHEDRVDPCPSGEWASEVHPVYGLGTLNFVHTVPRCADLFDRPRIVGGSVIGISHHVTSCHTLLASGCKCANGSVETG